MGCLQACATAWCSIKVQYEIQNPFDWLHAVTFRQHGQAIAEMCTKHDFPGPIICVNNVHFGQAAKG